METKALDDARESLIEKYAEPCHRYAENMAGYPIGVIKQHFREFADELAALSAQGEAAQPAAEGWEIDRSTASPILVYEKCSVIQDEQAFYLMRLIQADQAASPAASQDGGGGKHQCIHYPSHRCTCEPGRSLCLKPEDAAIYHGDIDGDSEI